MTAAAGTVRTAADAAGTHSPAEPSEYDPCDDDCGIRDVLDRLGERWSVLVIAALAKGARRFHQLQASVPGISQRMLTVTAKRLIRDGLVERTVYPTIPPQTDYRLTPMGESFAQTVLHLADWSRTHKDLIAASRLRFDLEHGAAAQAPERLE